VAFYGPDDTRASNAAVGIANAECEESAAMERWFSEEGDVRKDPAIGSSILRFVQEHPVKSVVVTDEILGCPHEEGVDYEGPVCPQCPFWAQRNRRTGEMQE
jgi:hypothetical protein